MNLHSYNFLILICMWFSWLMSQARIYLAFCTGNLVPVVIWQVSLLIAKPVRQHKWKHWVVFVRDSEREREGWRDNCTYSFIPASCILCFWLYNTVIVCIIHAGSSELCCYGTVWTNIWQVSTLLDDLTAGKKKEKKRETCI